METRRLSVLLVEDNPADVLLLRKQMSTVPGNPVEFSCVNQMSTVRERVLLGGLDCILLDLSLPESHGRHTFLEIRALAPDVPIVVLTGLGDETLALKLLQDGAQDYLVKGQVDGNMLYRSLRYAVERHCLQAALGSLHVDHLTQLPNARSFLILAEQQWKLACRADKEFLLLQADIKGLRKINETYGYWEGNRVLSHAAALLKQNARASDIVARWGGDEFVALYVDATAADAALITARLKEHRNGRGTTGMPHNLYELRLGMAAFHPKNRRSITELQIEAAEAIRNHSRPCRHPAPLVAK